MNIRESNSAMVTDLWSEVEFQVMASDYLEQAAQALAAGLYGRFSESIVLSRVFATVPFADLPPTNQQSVRRLIETAGPDANLKPDTPVLSLLGSCGEERQWCDRRQSRDHVGIPMLSSSFVGAIPMIARLLKELGVPLDWIDSHDSEMMVNTIGSTAGLFFVEDATAATDNDGRHIIAAQDFVSQYAVKSVFGIGGAYPTGQMAVIVVFCCQEIPRTVAEQFIALGAFFIAKTTRYVEHGRVFSD